MSTDIRAALASRRDEISSAVFSRLHDSTAVHYRQADQDLLHGRADRLVEAFLEALPGKPGIFIDYIGEIARERIGEGFALREIQLALSILEDQAWKLVAAVVPAGDQVAALGMVTTIIGAAKDQLANVYLQEMLDMRGRMASLGLAPETLAGGTDSGPASPEDCLAR
ncbi:MAG: hypothetical protein ABIK96_10850 [bacterium]